MLILSRKLNEIVQIGPDIYIQVMELSGSRVRLGICAPRQMPVHRAEVAQAIEEAKLRVANAVGQKEAEDA